MHGYRKTIAVIVVALTVHSASTGFALEIGDAAPNFTVVDTEGEELTLQNAGKDADVVVVCFTCNRCPIAIAYEDRFIDFNKSFANKGIVFVALNCNNKSENLEVMKQRAEEKGFNFTYAFDESGHAAKKYDAHVTPEMFVIHKGNVVYHGAFDDDLSDPRKHYVKDAVDAILAGNKPAVAETTPFGCGIRLK